jgi:hypothetical protein
VSGRELTALTRLVERLSATDGDGRRVYSSAQLHELRTRMRPDPTAAREYFHRLCAADPRWAELGPLFHSRDTSAHTTMLLDAMALGPFLRADRPTEVTVDA